MQGKVTSEAGAESAVYVGIDTCKAWLDVYLHPIGRSLRVANSETGLRELRRALTGLPIALVVIEATGKLHWLAHRALSAAGFPVAVVNPYRSRKLADALGQLAKTDAIDARVLAFFGEAIKPAATPVPAKVQAELAELVLARQAAKADATALANRIAAAENTRLKRLLAATLKAQEQLVAGLEQAISRLIESDETLARRFAILTSIKGIGPIVAATLVACLCELGVLPGRKVAMLAGVAPVNCDSGETRGQRHIKGGRAHVRSALYMAAVAAISRLGSIMWRAPRGCTVSRALGQSARSCPAPPAWSRCTCVRIT